MCVPFGPFLSLGCLLFGSVFARLPFPTGGGAAAGRGCGPSSSEAPGAWQLSQRLPRLQGFTSTRGKGTAL